VSRFTSHLGLTLLEYSDGRPVLRGDRCLWFLSTPLAYEVGAKGSGVFIIVPAFDRESYTDDELRDIRADGVTDLASIPFPARGLLPPDGPWVKAAVIHDAGYITRGWGGRMTRKQVDQLLKEAMEVLAVPSWKRAIIYAAVRVGGRNSFGT
jgi:hypothetical protein